MISHVKSLVIRYAPRRELSSSPRHEGACPLSTLGGGGVLSKATDVCVSGPSRACDGLPRGGCGGDGERRGCKAGSIALVDQPPTASKSRLPGSGQHTVKLPRLHSEEQNAIPPNSDNYHTWLKHQMLQQTARLPKHFIGNFPFRS